MGKSIVFVFLFFISLSAFAGDETCWLFWGSCLGSPQSACDQYVTSCSGSGGTYIASSQYDGTVCYSAVHLCSNGAYFNGIIQQGPTLTCLNGYSVSGQSCICAYPKGVFNGQCQTCPSGSSVNFDTGECDRECPVGQEYVQEFDSCLLKCDLGKVRNEQGYCVANCDYSTQEELNDLCYDKCPVGTSRGADMECHCPSGQEYFGSQCVISCGKNEIRDSLGMCKPNCSQGEALINGQCVPSTCPDGQELQQGQCVDKPENPNCGEGEVSDQNGMCIPACESGAMIGGQCAEVNCPDSQHLENGKCVDKDGTISCPAGMRASADGKSCVALECPDGQVISYTLNKCVDDPNKRKCPVGQHLEGVLCVNDNNQNCPEHTHWEANCKKCVRNGSPIGVCGGVAGDMDGDGIPDSSDSDIDGDGIPNASDSDTDGDGIPNSSDSDDDNDGVPDLNDLTPQGPGTTNTNTKCVGPNCDDDGDGIPNKDDPDADGDGNLDDQETEKAGKPGSSLGDLYEPKGLTLTQAWYDFTVKVAYSPIVSASSAFFTVPYFSSSCPTWILPTTDFYPAITIDILCSNVVIMALQLAGLIVLIVAAWVAFRIAVL